MTRSETHDNLTNHPLTTTPSKKSKMKTIAILSLIIPTVLVFSSTIHAQEGSLSLPQFLKESDAVILGKVVHTKDGIGRFRNVNNEEFDSPYVKQKFCVEKILWGSILLDREGCVEYYSRGEIRLTNEATTIIFVNKSSPYWSFVYSNHNIKGILNLDQNNNIKKSLIEAIPKHLPIDKCRHT